MTNQFQSCTGAIKINAQRQNYIWTFSSKLLPDSFFRLFSGRLDLPPPQLSLKKKKKKSHRECTTSKCDPEKVEIRKTRKKIKSSNDHTSQDVVDQRRLRGGKTRKTKLNRLKWPASSAVLDISSGLAYQNVNFPLWLPQSRNFVSKSAEWTFRRFPFPVMSRTPLERQSMAVTGAI